VIGTGSVMVTVVSVVHPFESFAYTIVSLAQSPVKCPETWYVISFNEYCLRGVPPMASASISPLLSPLHPVTGMVSAWLNSSFGGRVISTIVSLVQRLSSTI